MPIAACAAIRNYAPLTCTVPSGGVAQMFIFDPKVWDFTQGAATGANIGGAPYAVMTDLGTSSKIYPINFTRMSAEYMCDQKNTDGTAPSYTHKWTIPVANIGQLMAQWSQLIDLQAFCCGLGVITVFNTGKIIIAGENSVNAATLAVPFYVYQDGSKANSGKKVEDQNQNIVTLTTGQYNRPLYELTWGYANLVPLIAATV